MTETCRKFYIFSIYSLMSLGIDGMIFLLRTYNLPLFLIGQVQFQNLHLCDPTTSELINCLQ